MISRAAERFLHYVSFDTQSKDDEEQVPSTEKQRVLAEVLKRELEEMGASDVRMSENGYVYAVIPATTDKPVKAWALFLIWIRLLPCPARMCGRVS